MYLRCFVVTTTFPCMCIIYVNFTNVDDVKKLHHYKN